MCAYCIPDDRSHETKRLIERLNFIVFLLCFRRFPVHRVLHQTFRTALRITLLDFERMTRVIGQITSGARFASATRRIRYENVARTTGLPPPVSYCTDNNLRHDFDVRRFRIRLPGTNALLTFPQRIPHGVHFVRRFGFVVVTLHDCDVRSQNNSMLVGMNYILHYNSRKVLPNNHRLYFLV